MKRKQIQSLDITLNCSDNVLKLNIYQKSTDKKHLISKEYKTVCSGYPAVIESTSIALDPDSQVRRLEWLLPDIAMKGFSTLYFKTTILE